MHVGFPAEYCQGHRSKDCITAAPTEDSDAAFLLKHYPSPLPSIPNPPLPLPPTPPLQSQEAFIVSPWLALALRIRPGEWQFVRVNAEEVVVQPLSVNAYLAFKESLVANDHNYNHDGSSDAAITRRTGWVDGWVGRYKCEWVGRGHCVCTSRILAGRQASRRVSQ